jgi:hypothetical protein
MQKRLLDLLDHPSAELVEDLTGGSAAAGTEDEEPAAGAPPDDQAARKPARAARSQSR